MTPYTSDRVVTTTGANEIVAVPFPGRCTITRVSVTRIGTGAIVADFYSRAFTTPTAASIARVKTEDGSHVRLLLKSAAAGSDGKPVAFAVGDVITVAGTTVGGYNTTHRVTARIDDLTYDTNVSYTADATGGTATLAIPTAEQLAYKVLTQLTGNDAAEASPGVVYHNQDPLPNVNIGVKRRLYVKLATAAQYRISVTCHESIGTN